MLDFVELATMTHQPRAGFDDLLTEDGGFKQFAACLVVGVDG